MDYFAVYFPPTDSIYVLPIAEAGVRGCLRLTPVLNGQQKFIRWAADYTWEKHVERLRENVDEQSLLVAEECKI